MGGEHLTLFWTGYPELHNEEQSFALWPGMNPSSEGVVGLGSI